MTGLDISDREVQDRLCQECGRDYKRVVVFATKDGDAYAVVSAECHGHPDYEAWLDVTFGSWDEPFHDQVSISCRITPKGAVLVDALVGGRDKKGFHGTCLTREEAFAHPSLPMLWELVDLVATTVPEVEEQTT